MPELLSSYKKKDWLSSNLFLKNKSDNICKTHIKNSINVRSLLQPLLPTSNLLLTCPGLGKQITRCGT